MSGKKREAKPIKAKRITPVNKEESAESTTGSASLDDKRDQVFDLLWSEYCMPNHKPSDYRIFRRPQTSSQWPDLDFHFEFTTLHDRDIPITNPKTPVQLWSDFYRQIDKKALKEKYIPEVSKFFKRNRVTKHGCIRSKFYAKLPSVVIHQNYEIPRITGGDAFMLAISDKVQLKTIGEKQMFFAVEGINDGEGLVIEAPMALGIPLGCDCSEDMYFQCFLCRAPVINPVACSVCSVAVFCSPGCKASCDPIHVWECKALRTHFLKSDDLMYVALRMLLIGVNSNFNIHDQYYSLIHNLPCNIDLFSEPHKKLLIRKTLKVLLYLTNQTSIFKWMDEKKRLGFIKGINNKHVFIGGRYLQHLAQAITNVVYFPCEEYSFFFQTKGAVFSLPGILPTVIKIAQDCQPNAQLIFRRNYCVVKALRLIEKHELITVNFYPCGELEVHNIKNKYFRDRKFKCECRTCEQPYNKLCGEILLKCKICNAISGKCNDEWKCFKCHTTLNAYYMDCKKKTMEAKYMALQRTKFTDTDSMIAFLQEYPTVFCTVSSEYIEVCLRCCRKMLYASKFVSLIQLIDEIIKFLNINLHKYSFLKLHIIVKIMNFILAYHRYHNPTKKTSSILYVCAREIDELSSFHCFGEEWTMLYKLVWNLGFISMNPSAGEVQRMRAWEDLLRRAGCPYATLRIFDEVDPAEEEEARRRQKDTFEEMNSVFAPYWLGIEWDLVPKAIDSD